MRSLIRRAAVAGIAVTLSSCTEGSVPAPSQAVPTARADRGIGTTFTSFEAPNATLTLPTDINARGQIVGRYASGGRTHGFLRDVDGSITIIDYPAAGFTVAGSINNSGTIAGWYTLPATPTIRHGFMLQDSVYTSFDPPGASFTNALGISESGDIVGRFCTRTVCRTTGNGDFHGFLYRDGEITVLDVPGATETDAFKEQANGAIVGGVNQGGVEGLFIYRDGAFETFALPNGKNVSLDNGGTNTRGDIVGTYCDLPGICLIGPFPTHGFLWSNGELTTIDYPRAKATAALGINEKGDIVGGYVDLQGHSKGFLLSAH